VHPSPPPSRLGLLGLAGRAQLGRFGLALAVSGIVVALMGLFRLTRQFPSAASSPSLLVPFLFPVLALALEAGVLVALSAAHVRALVLTPAGRSERIKMTLPLLATALAVLLAAQLVPRGTEQPGQFANDLIQSAVDSCGTDGEVSVPLLGLTVRCAEPRRIAGPMPGVRSVQVAMRKLTFSDDLRRVEIDELQLDAKRALSVRLRATHARIAGIAPWSRSTRLSTAGRLFVLGLLAFALWAAGAWLGARPKANEGDSARVARARLRWLGVLFAGLPGAVVAVGFIVLEQEQAAPLTYVGAGAAGVAAFVGLRLLVRRMPQMFSSFDAF
jgi:hypothetical protein